jgi:fumarylacetoacetate (FAA) hydrolase
MRLATIPNQTPDGQLVLVSADHQRAVSAAPIATSLQHAIENWHEVEPHLRVLSDELETGAAETLPFDTAQALAPLPRAWQWLDGSAFQSHGDLMSAVFNTEKLPYDQRPLMYQGMSDRFLSGTEDARFPSEADGIDFEGEFGVIVDRVPMGTPAERAGAHIRLIVLINDWSLRAIAPIEMKTGFGWIQAKPASAIAPIAVTPDELGEHWRRARVCLDLDVHWNGERFGAANGEPMAFGFDQLIAHAARTRDLVAGTVIGSGTVSNENYREIGSSCIAERRGIELLDDGAAKTHFMRFGDRVRMEALLPGGGSVFGAIDQRAVPAF